ncbi:MAG TPA: hypothetical protein VGM39_25115 [Kofleriaceae bacterium]
MRERIALGGIEQSLGVIVLGLFLLFGVLAVIGGIALFALGAPIEAGSVGLLAVGILFDVLWGRWVWSYARRISSVAIDDDGSWHLRGMFWIPRGTIAAGEHRKVDVSSVERVIVYPARRFNVMWATIQAGGRTWQTMRVPESVGYKRFRRLADLVE